MNKKIVLLSIVLIVLAIILGAFAAHGLKKVILDPDRISSFETGVRYQMYMGIALLGLGLSDFSNRLNLKLFLRFIVAGAILFSGSIYLLSLSELLPFSVSFLGPITPIGGLLLITSWVVLFVNVLRYKE